LQVIKIEMGAGASSKRQRDAPSSGPSAVSATSSAPQTFNDVQLEKSQQLVVRLQKQLQGFADICNQNAKLKLRVSELEVLLLADPQTPKGGVHIQELEAHVRDLRARLPLEPPQLFDVDVASFAPPLPPIDESRMTPALVSTAADLRMRFSSASSDAQALMRTMREIRLEWNRILAMHAESGM